MSSFNVTIEKITSEGMGMARHQGKIVFVSFVMPGEEVRVRVVRSHKSYDEAELIDVIKPSSSRLKAPCAYYGVCGGCNLQHMTYEAQLAAKKQIVADALTRIAKLNVLPIADVLPSPVEYGYRSRIQLHQGDAGVWGFHQRKSNAVVEIDKCLLASDAVNKKLHSFHPPLQKGGRGDLAQVDRKKIPLSPPFSKGEVRKEIREDDENFFTQVNQIQNRNLVDLVMRLARELKPNVALELYAGAGNFTFPLSKICEKIWAVESSREAVAFAQSKNSDIIEWHAADAASFTKKFLTKNIIPDLLLVDPPRAGLEGAVESIIKLQSKAIIYVSCDPATFARDIKKMMDDGKYSLERVYPVDMFSQTAHVEVVGLLLCRKDTF
ncbi:class I SAM-dependent RNA methyltransferase [bacterium]|nr:class I SAM-dependent RNA methyltransferase [bacterium]